MITAQKAREFTNEWLINRNKAYQEIAEQRLVDIYAQIERNAKNGLNVYTIGSKTGFFKTQEVERIVRDKLTYIGYKIDTSGSTFTIRW